MNLDLSSKKKEQLGNVAIRNISIDSRNIKANTLFVPLEGEKKDGHLFIADAFSNGAVSSLCKKDFEITNPFKLGNFPLLKVDDTLCSLQRIGRCIRQKFNGKIIGITGSCGKTTTKEYVCAVMKSKFDVFKNDGNFNGQIGVPLTLFKLDNTADFAVIEMGISKFNEMDILTDLVCPDIAIVTNIGHSHLEYLKSVENVYKEKIKIFRRFNKNSVLFINGDDFYLKRLKNLNLPFKTFTYGIKSQDLDFRAINVEQRNGVTYFDVIHKNNVFKGVKINSLGQRQVTDALVAIALGMFFDIDFAEIKLSILHARFGKNRQSVKCISLTAKNNSVIHVKFIDDCYNANPESMIASISVLNGMYKCNRKVAVLSDMLEQGSFSEDLHRELGKFIAKTDLDILITTGAYSLVTNRVAKKYNNKLCCYHLNSNEEIYKKLTNILSDQDIVLFKGSRGFKLEEIISRFI